MAFHKQVVWQNVALILICCYLGVRGDAQCNPEWCGSKNVTFPFWINNPTCGLSGFQIKCMENEGGKMSLFLGVSVNGNDTELEILEMSYAGFLVINSTSLKAMSCDAEDSAYVDFRLAEDGPFTIHSSNKFVVIGCGGIGGFSTFPIYCSGGIGCNGGSCASACMNQDDPIYCNTYGCCEAGIRGGSKSINFTGGGSCGFSTLLEPATWVLPQGDFGHYGRGHYGIRLQWAIFTGNCSSAPKGTSNYYCADAAQCSTALEGGHTCECLTGYQGNGYSNGTGCTDVNECEADLNECVDASEGGMCHNLPGTYNCSCAKDYSGNGFQNGTRCQRLSSSNLITSAIIGSVSSVIGVSFGGCVLFWVLRRCALKNAGDKNFVENGGVEMQERIASMGGKKSLIMFSEADLKIASNNYSMELGKGGFATVYKGVLLDGMPVAIKKPKSYSPEFNNEIVILSHMNHRNVVKLIGCCLRTELPLLVYEYVSNGTLFDHLQQCGAEKQNLPWERRRQIAIETAEGISYVHNAASQSIFHRDIKSSNILLDDTFNPKVADFGISRLRPNSGETHLSTIVPSGTPGYVDPEFIRSNQFTEKSDVFSFGVVLVELLTGLKPLLIREGEAYTLYDHFVDAIRSGHLAEILDERVMNEENRVQMEKMANLARACLEEEGRARPSMREVVEELVSIRATTNRILIDLQPQKQLQLGASTQPTSSFANYNTSQLSPISSEDPSASFI